MGDDGVGAVVVRALRERDIGDGVETVERPNAEMGLLKYFTSSARVIVVDALDAGASAGSVFRFTPDEGGVTALRSNNIHGMGVGHLVTNARLSGIAPDVVIYGVQVGDVRPNADTLTPEVDAAAREVVEMIVEETREERHSDGG